MYYGNGVTFSGVNQTMEKTAIPPSQNTQYTSRTKLISARFPLDIAAKLEARGNISALIIAATAKALEREDEEPATVKTAPAL
jgi:hypothetical protein